MPRGAAGGIRASIAARATAPRAQANWARAVDDPSGSTTPVCAQRAVRFASRQREPTLQPSPSSSGEGRRRFLEQRRKKLAGHSALRCVDPSCERPKYHAAGRLRTTREISHNLYVSRCIAIIRASRLLRCRRGSRVGKHLPRRPAAELLCCC